MMLPNVLPAMCAGLRRGCAPPRRASGGGMEYPRWRIAKGSQAGELRRPGTAPRAVA
jgi:hypothetical protein